MKSVKYFNIHLLCAAVILYAVSSPITLLANNEPLPTSTPTQPISDILREVQTINSKIPKPRSPRFTTLVTTIALLEAAYIVYRDNPYNITSCAREKIDKWYQDNIAQTRKDDKATSNEKKDNSSDSGINNNQNAPGASNQ